MRQSLGWRSPYPPSVADRGDGAPATLPDVGQPGEGLAPADFAPPRPRSRSRWRLPRNWWLVVIPFGALTVRLVYVLVIARAPTGVGGDAGFYETSANLIAHGHFYYRTIVGHTSATAEHPPLYPLLLSTSSLLGASSLLAHRIVSCVVGVATVALIGLLGRRLIGRQTGIVAASIAALYPPFVAADGLVMSEPLFTAAVAAALLLALALRTRPTIARSIGLGAVIGCAALARSEGWLLVPLLAWPAVGLRMAGGLRRMIVATLAAAVVLAPWVLRNEVVFHRLILATDANTALAGANCSDTYYGHDIGWWSLACLEQQQTRMQLYSGDASTNAAFTYAGDHLSRLPLIASVRVLRTFDLYQPLRQGNREPRRQWIDVVGLVLYYPLLGLAGLGLARPRKLRIPGSRVLLLAPVWMAVLVSATGWGIGRFRIAADISIIVLASTVLAGALVSRRLRRYLNWRSYVDGGELLGVGGEPAKEVVDGSLYRVGER